MSLGLHIWGSGTERQQITKSIALFEEANPDIKVEEIVLDSSTWQPKLLQLLSGDSPPDVFLWYPGPKTEQLIEQGVVASLTQMWDDYGLDYFIPEGLREAVSYDGEIYNLPWGYHPTIVYYNTKIFNDLGLEPPTTIAEFEAICDAVKAAGYYPLSSGWSGLWRSSYVIEALIPSLAGMGFYNDLMKQTISWGDPTLREVYDIWERWIRKDYWVPDPRSRKWADGLTIFMNNEAAMYFLGTYGVPLLEEAGWKLGEDYGAFFFPQENPDYPISFTGPFDVWAMASAAPHPVEAHRLLAFLATTGPQTMRAIYHGGMACNRFVTAYNAIGMSIQDAMNSGAAFAQVIGNAMPAEQVQLINKAAVPDFYDTLDIEAFIEACEEARALYWESKQ